MVISDNDINTVCVSKIDSLVRIDAGITRQNKLRAIIQHLL